MSTALTFIKVPARAHVLMDTIKIKAIVAAQAAFLLARLVRLQVCASAVPAVT